MDQAGQSRSHRELDELKRRIYLVCLLASLPVLAVFTITRGGIEPGVRMLYPLLGVVLAGVAFGLLQRRLAIGVAERVVIATLAGVWFFRLLGALYVGTDIGAAVDVVTGSIGPGLALLVIIAFLANQRQAGLWLSLGMLGLFVTASLPRLLPALGRPEERDAALSIGGIWLYVAAVLALTHVLAHIKERFAVEQDRTADLARLAGTDPLTGAANRRRGVEVLEQRLAEAQRYRRPWAVALLDLDGFKQLNDELGHDAGDRALQEVIAGLRQDLREVDTLVRWGGDELLVVTPETGLGQAGRSAERWRARVAELGIGSSGAPLTVSVGVTTWRDGDTPDSIVRRADRAMYRVKARGGDGVAVVKPRAARAERTEPTDRIDLTGEGEPSSVTDPIDVTG